MAQNQDGTLAQIMAAVLDDTVPVSSLLQKCVVLGGLTRSTTMSDWASKELHGYDRTKDEIPDYRRVSGTLTVRLTNMAGYQPVERVFSPMRELPEQIRNQNDWETAHLTNDIGELEGWVDASDGTIRLSVPWETPLINFVGPAYGQQATRVEAFYLAVSTATINGLLVRVRTAVAELVAELLKLTPEGQDVPDRSAADEAMHVTINGHNNTFTYAPQRAGDGGINTNTIGTSTAGSTTVAGAASAAVGSQSGSGDHATVVGGQAVHGEHNAVTGRDATPASGTDHAETGGWWTRLRHRGLFLTVATILAAIVAVLTWLGFTPSSPSTGQPSSPRTSATITPTALTPITAARPGSNK